MAPTEMPMPTHRDTRAKVRELQQSGFDAEQGERYEFVFHAARTGVLTLMCAKYGVDPEEMLDALMDSQRLNAEAAALMARMEASPAYGAYIFSGTPL